MMKSLATLALTAAAGLSLSACTGYDDGYGFSGVSVGYGASNYGGYGYDGYGYDNYGYAGNYGNPYWGWSGNYYYPGTGYYVYDSNRRRYRMNSSQTRYWAQRRQNWRGQGGYRDNWGSWDRSRGDRDRGNYNSGSANGSRGTYQRGDDRGTRQRGDSNGSRGTYQRGSSNAARGNPQRTDNDGSRSRSYRSNRTEQSTTQPATPTRTRQLPNRGRADGTQNRRRR